MGADHGEKRALDAAWQKYPSLLLASARLSQRSPHQEPRKDTHGKPTGMGAKRPLGA